MLSTNSLRRWKMPGVYHYSRSRDSSQFVGSYRAPFAKLAAWQLSQALEQPNTQPSKQAIQLCTMHVRTVVSCSYVITIILLL